MVTRFFFGPPRPRPKKAALNIKSLLVRCPFTSKLTNTGQAIEEKLWPAAKIKRQRLICTHCGVAHTWTKADVVLGRPMS